MKYLKENFSDILIGGFGLYALFKGIVGLINGRITLSQRGGGQSTILYPESIEISFYFLVPSIAFLIWAMLRILKYLKFNPNEKPLFIVSLALFFSSVLSVLYIFIFYI